MQIKQENLLKIRKITEIYGRELDQKGVFYNVLEQIGKHIIKLTKLKENEDWEGHLKEEVADMFILASALMDLEKVNQQEFDKALDHFIETIEKLY